ncbi:MAG: antitoxin [Lachnospiraceae bacterium]|nr:antitoxin [Lachnospiraceae bacterium]
MPMSEARKKANEKYNAKAYDQVKIIIKKGQREQVKEFAESQGLSLNAYINKLIADDMGAALTVPTKQQGD